MKRLFIALFAIVAVGLSTHAQTYNAGRATGGTNIIAATVTNTTTAVTSAIPATRGSTLTIQPTLYLSGAGTTAVVISLDTSVDGSEWQSGAYRVSITPAGATKVGTITNLSLGSVGFVRVGSIENPNANSITNLIVRYSQKVGY